MDANDRPDFSGCLLYCAFSGAGTSEDAFSWTLFEYPEWREIGGRLFLLGRIPEVSPDQWLVGRETAVAWSAVSSFVVFRTREQYLESAGRYKKSLKERFLR